MRTFALLTILLMLIAVAVKEPSQSVMDSARGVIDRVYHGVATLAAVGDIEIPSIDRNVLGGGTAVPGSGEADVRVTARQDDPKSRPVEAGETGGNMAAEPVWTLPRYEGPAAPAPDPVPVTSVEARPLDVARVTDVTAAMPADKEAAVYEDLRVLYENADRMLRDLR